MNLHDVLGSRDVLAISSAVCIFAVGGVASTHWMLHRTRRDRAPRLSEADQRIERDPIVRDGTALHHHVPMERWCVTRDDLHQFRRLVKRAVQEGRIAPTSLDPFDRGDDTVGPSIHSVCEQFIVPVTTAAGGASWALMKHPEGLPCDLFVTHGWAEGIYEFVDKVLHSWPPAAHHAYCCMLSNPQALDISGLIATPMDSPFAKALHSATYMLVAPNRKGSIYTRVWCAYEAFLGYSQGKIISTASSPIPGFWPSILRCQFVCLLGVGTSGILIAVTGVEGRILQILSCAASSALAPCWWIVRYRPRSLLRRSAEFAGEFDTGVLAAGAILDVPLEGAMTVASLIVVGAFIIAIPYGLESDRLVLLEANEQSEELQRGFTGRLRDAQCSVQADGERIRRELAESGSEEEVDKAVSTLICMGMFSPQLRRLVDLVGVLGDVSRWSRSIIIFASLIQALVPIDSIMYDTCGIVWLHFLVWAQLMILLGLFAIQSADGKAFAVGSFVLELLVLPIWVVELSTGSDLCVKDFTLAGGVNPLIFLLLLLGPVRVAQVPWLGPKLVHLILGEHDKERGASFKDRAAAAVEGNNRAPALTIGAI